MAVIFDKYIPDYLNPGIPRIGESECARDDRPRRLISPCERSACAASVFGSNFILLAGFPVPRQTDMNDIGKIYFFFLLHNLVRDSSGFLGYDG